MSGGEKDPECRGLLVEATPSAVFVSASKSPFNKWWIPRSQIGYMRKTNLANGDVEIVFTIPEWLIEKKQCWELVP